jgi:hypothetical protein
MAVNSVWLTKDLEIVGHGTIEQTSLITEFDWRLRKITKNLRQDGQEAEFLPNTRLVFSGCTNFLGHLKITELLIYLSTLLL